MVAWQYEFSEFYDAFDGFDYDDHLKLAKRYEWKKFDDDFKALITMLT